MTFYVAFSRSIETCKLFRRVSWEEKRYLFAMRNHQFTYCYDPHSEDMVISPVVNLMEIDNRDKGLTLESLLFSNHSNISPHHITKEDAQETDWELTDIPISDYVKDYNSIP